MPHDDYIQIMEPRTPFRPERGAIYTNAGVGAFQCLAALPQYDALMQNTASGWTFVAHGVGQYKDGTIDWDYSTSGRYEMTGWQTPKNPLHQKNNEGGHKKCQM